MSPATIHDVELQRFARLAAPLLHGTAADGYGPRAARNRAGRGLEYLDTRQYEPGDDVRNIDWRQSARRGDVVIRRYRDETAADWFLCLDCSASVGWGARKWPLTVQMAMALVYTLLYAGHRVGLLLFSHQINGLCDLGRGPRHYATLVAALYGQQPAEAVAGHGKTSNLGLCGPRLAQNSNAVIVSDFLEPDAMQSDLKSIRMRAANVSAIQVLDTDEVKVGASGPMALQDIESGATLNVSMADAVTRRAEERLHSHVALLRDVCTSLDIRFTSCRTDQHWQHVLLEHLQR